jgi:hypothetical protein
MELLAARQQNPVAPPYVFSGKVIRPNVELDPETPLPIGMRTWLDCPMVEMFRRDAGLSLADQDSAWRGDGRPGKETVAKPPAKPADSNEFYLFSKRLERYMVDSDRWDLAEARLHDLHREDVMDLLQHHDLEDVLLYDSDFRFTRHRLQDRRWGSRDVDIFRKRVTDPLHRRSRDASPAGSSLSSPTSSGKLSTRSFFDIDIALDFIPAEVRQLIIKQISAKSFRSGAATAIVTAGNAGFVAAAFLGHSDPKITKQYYHKGDDSERLQAAPALTQGLLVGA